MKTFVGLAIALVVLSGCSRETSGPVDVQPTSTRAATATPAASPIPSPEPTFDPGRVILPTVAIPTATPKPDPANSLSAKLDSVAARTIAIRELFSLGSVDREFISREQLTARLGQELEEDRDDISETQELYRTLGILEPEDDLFEINLGILGEGVLGLYDTEEEKLYIVGDADEFSPGDELTYVHEYTHALQQQHFDIHATRMGMIGNSDESRAFLALTEGDATTSQLLYMFNTFDEQTQSEAIEGSARLDTEKLDAAPHVVQKTVAFPYEEGVQFAISLLQAGGGWDLVSDALVDPPVSTEQVLHPDKYLAREEPLSVEMPDAAQALGEDWTLLSSDTLGEFIIKSYLEDGVDVADATTASTGWGGDAYRLFQDPQGRNLLVSIIAWDTEQDAQEFLDTFVAFMEAKTELTWETETEGSPGGTIMGPEQVVYADILGTETPVIFAPDAESLALVRQVIQ